MIFVEKIRLRVFGQISQNSKKKNFLSVSDSESSFLKFLKMFIIIHFSNYTFLFSFHSKFVEHLSNENPINKNSNFYQIELFNSYFRRVIVN